MVNFDPVRLAVDLELACEALAAVLGGCIEWRGIRDYEVLLVRREEPYSESMPDAGCMVHRTDI